MKVIDLTGQKFGRWTVLERDNSKKDKVYWICKCECGTIKSVRGSTLRNGESQSCGCLQKELAAKKLAIQNKKRSLDLKNQRFGKLIALYDTGERRNRQVVWHCKCDCGNECDVIATSLQSGNTKSCGCLQKEMLIENNKQKIKIIPKGTKFGKLTVIKLLDERGKRGETIYQCQCDCGKITNVFRSNLIRYNTLSCGCSKISKGEFLIEQLLIQNKSIYEKQKMFKNCLFIDTNYHAYFDFYVDNRYIIEFDGEQHFKVVRFNNISKEKAQSQLEYTQKHDKIKNQWCKDNNIPLIRIPYTHLDELCLEDLIPETSKFLIKGDN